VLNGVVRSSCAQVEVTATPVARTSLMCERRETDCGEAVRPRAGARGSVYQTPGSRFVHSEATDDTIKPPKHTPSSPLGTWIQRHGIPKLSCPFGERRPYAPPAIIVYDRRLRPRRQVSAGAPSMASAGASARKLRYAAVL
jgi:hypothetical protein